MLRVENLQVRFGADLRLDDINLHVDAGEMVVVTGTNGAGKSTLLRTIAGFVQETRGHILFNDTDLHILRAEERALRGIGFIDGARPVFDELTVDENLRMGAWLQRRAESNDVLRSFPRLAAKRKYRASELSGGERRLLAFAQSLCRRPHLLLADEVTIGLDEESAAEVTGAMSSLAQLGTAVLWVDHQVAEFGGRTIFMDAGRILFDGIGRDPARYELPTLPA